MRKFSSKKLFACVLSLAMTLSISAMSASANESEVNITILGTTDIHGRYMPWDYAVDGPNTSGSLSQVSTLVKEVQKENPNTIVVDVGDLIQDNSSELFQDMNNHPAIKVLNALKYDVWTIGNHEFDYGIPKLDKLANQFNGKVLGGNLYKDSGEQYYPSYTILERDGVKVGVIGITTAMVQEFKEDTDVFDGFKFTDAKEETKKAIKELEGKVDVMVGVLHMGMENENNTPNTGVKDIANACPELDVIFAGHMHKLENSTVNGVFIIEPDKYATHVARVDLTLSKEESGYQLKEVKGENIPVKDYESDPQAERLLSQGHTMARNDANVVVGQLTKLDFVPENKIKGIPVHQLQETPLTNFFGEVMLHYSKGADVTAHQIDNDNAALAIGSIKKKDIANCYQYAGGEVTVYKITGQDLKDYMEWSAAYFNTAKPGDVTISFDPVRRNSKYSTHDIFSGIRYEFDLTEKVGSRVKHLTRLDGTPITMEEELTIGMNAYRMKALISAGGALEGRKFEQVYSTQEEAAFGEVEGRIRNLAARYITEEKNGVLEGRMGNTWKITGTQETPDYVIELINAGVLEIGAAENGKSNVISINIKNTPTKEEITALAAKVEADPALFKDTKTNGDLYQKINDFRKGSTNTTEEKDTETENPDQGSTNTGNSTDGKNTESSKTESSKSESKDTDNKKDTVKEEVNSSEKVLQYIVKKNDTLWKIARDYKVDLKVLIKQNKLSNPDLIYTNQKLIIKVK